MKHKHIPIPRDDDGIGRAPCCPPAIDGDAGIDELPLINPGHLSARTLGDVAALREKHFAKGYLPQSDLTQHGTGFFTVGCQQFLSEAARARSPSKRRRGYIAAIAMLVALVDAQDQRKDDDEG